MISTDALEALSLQTVQHKFITTRRLPFSRSWGAPTIEVGAWRWQNISNFSCSTQRFQQDRYCVRPVNAAKRAIDTTNNEQLVVIPTILLLGRDLMDALFTVWTSHHSWRRLVVIYPQGGLMRTLWNLRLTKVELSFLPRPGVKHDALDAHLPLPIHAYDTIRLLRAPEEHLWQRNKISASPLNSSDWRRVGYKKQRLDRPYTEQRAGRRKADSFAVFWDAEVQTLLIKPKQTKFLVQYLYIWLCRLLDSKFGAPGSKYASSQNGLLDHVALLYCGVCYCSTIALGLSSVHIYLPTCSFSRCRTHCVASSTGQVILATQSERCIQHSDQFPILNTA